MRCTWGAVTGVSVSRTKIVTRKLNWFQHDVHNECRGTLIVLVLYNRVIPYSCRRFEGGVGVQLHSLHRRLYIGAKDKLDIVQVAPNKQRFRR